MHAFVRVANSIEHHYTTSSVLFAAAMSLFPLGFRLKESIYAFGVLHNERKAPYPATVTKTQKLFGYVHLLC